jgi:hypothetical protein
MRVFAGRLGWRRPSPWKEHTLRQALRSLVVVIVVTCFPLTSAEASGAVAPAASPPCDGAWHVMAIPHVRHGYLWSVSALSPSDAWAVGGRGHRAYTAHWNGTRWTEVPSPLLPQVAVLTGVSAVSDADVWVVGSWGPIHDEHPLVAHWDGASWTRATLPDLGVDFVYLADVAAKGGEVWVVGTRQARGAFHTTPLILGWDGRAWTVSPLRGTFGGFTDLSGVAIGDDGTAWAVGTIAKRRSYGLLEQWTGKRWYQVGSPFRRITGLDAVDVIGSSDVLAIGESLHQTATRLYSLRGTRRSWTLDHVPFGPSYDGAMEDVAWESSGTAWAVGWNQRHRNPQSGRGVIERWDGRHWVVVRDPAAAGDALLGVSSAAGTTFAVGLTAGDRGLAPVAEYHC